MTDTLKDVQSFGEVAAEEDDVLEYFIPTKAVDDIRNKDIVLVLGRKGTGKTALVRYFTESDEDARTKALNLKSYPWSVHQKLKNYGASEMEAYVSSWRYVIIVQACLAVLATPTSKRSAHSIELTKFFTKNYGGIDISISSILQVEKVSFSDLTFEPTILGSKLGSVSFKSPNENSRFGMELDSVSDALLNELEVLCHKLNVTNIQLHFDELDLGLSKLEESDKQMLTGLVLAARYVRKSAKTSELTLSPVVYLRTDLWAELAFSDKNKISESQALNLSWESEERKRLTFPNIVPRQQLVEV